MPYDSNQIAQLIAAQQQMILNQASMAQQIGPGMPSMMSPSPAGGYDPRASSNSAAGMATAGVLGAAPSVLGGMSTLGMLGGLGVRPLRPFMAFDPFSMGFAAHGAVGGGMRGLAAGMGVGGAMMGVGALATGALEQMYGGAMNYAQTGNIMQQTYGGTFRPQAMGMGGFGFGARERQRMSSLIRTMSHIPDLESDVGELQRIFQKMEQTGMMTGGIGVEQLGSRFRDGVKTLRMLSKVMGTTMEEAMPLFQEARQSGFFTSQDIMRNALQRQVTAGIVGMSQRQIGDLQQTGANIVTMMGGSNRAAGASGALAQAGIVSTALRTGVINEQQLAAATGGLTGTQGVQSLTSTLQKAGMQLASSGVGTMLQAAAAEVDPETGRLTGKLRQDVIERAASRQISQEELQRMAQQVTGNQGRRAQFATMREEFQSQLAATGPQGVIGVIRSAMGRRENYGLTMEEVASHMLRGYTDLNKPQRDMIIKIAEEGDKIASDAREYAFRQMDALTIKEAYRTRSIGNMWDQFKRRVARDIAQPFQKMGEKIAGGIGEIAEDIDRSWTGISVTNITGEQARRFQGAFVAGGKELANYSRGVGALRDMADAQGRFWLGGAGGGGLTGGPPAGMTGGGPGDLRYARGADRGVALRMLGGESAADRLQEAASDLGVLSVLRVNNIQAPGRGGVVTQVANVGGYDVELGITSGDIEKMWTRVDEIRQGKVSVAQILDRSEGKGMTGANRKEAGRILTSMGEKLRKTIIAKGPKFKSMDARKVIKELEESVGAEMGMLRKLGVAAKFPEIYAGLAQEHNLTNKEGAPPPETLLEIAADAYGLSDGTPTAEMKRRLHEDITNALGESAGEFAKVEFGISAKLLRASGVTRGGGQASKDYTEISDILTQSGPLSDEDRTKLKNFGITTEKQISGAREIIRGIAGAQLDTSAGGLGKLTGLSERNLEVLERHMDQQTMTMFEERSRLFAGQLGKIGRGPTSMLASALARAERAGAGGLRKGVLEGLGGLQRAMMGAQGAKGIEGVRTAGGDLITQLGKAMASGDEQQVQAVEDVLREIQSEGGEAAMSLQLGARKVGRVLKTRTKKVDKEGGIIDIGTLSKAAGVSEEQARIIAEKAGVRQAGEGIVAEDVDKFAKAVAQSVMATGLVKEGAFAGLELRQDYEREFGRMVGKMGEAFNGMALFVDVLNHDLPGWQEKFGKSGVLGNYKLPADGGMSVPEGGGW